MWLNFTPWVVNKTNSAFSNDELTHLYKGLKYNLSYKHKNWIRMLASEAETALNQLPTSEQEYMRYQAADNTK